MSKPFWTPTTDTKKHALLSKYLHYLNTQHHKQFDSYAALHAWSINDPTTFWSTCAEFCQIKFTQNPTEIVKHRDNFWETRWFINATLNFAENLLTRRDNHTALIYIDEQLQTQSLSYAELFKRSQGLAQHLLSLGVKPKDRVAGYVTNKIETVIAMLAAATIGAIWTACSPEFGIDALIDRFSQIEPTILFTQNTHRFNGKEKNLETIINQLKQHLPSVKYFIDIETIHQYTSSNPFFTPLPFDHPLYILYTSGTTGKPKCIVHGAGNVLIQHKKELMLHTDLHSEDKLFFYTTCSWMMWHWMVSGLSVGATLVLYDGSPFYPKKSQFFDIIETLKVNIAGCGAKIIESCLKENLHIHKTHDLSAFRTLLTTGSPLIKESFLYLYHQVKSDLQVSSISGGSDLLSCFALGNPLLPVYPEELQCRGLGMAVEIFDENGHSVIDQVGELVCTKPFPSMPLYFWNDHENLYFKAYFNRFKNTWTHGDYAKITVHHGLIIYGRSDATLNPGGVRIGTAEIYEQVLKLDEIVDCVAAGQQCNGDEIIILFVKLKPQLTLNDHLIEQIKQHIKNNTSPFHVPKKILQVSDIPKTVNGKTMEIAVKNIVNGKPISHTDVLANPEILKEFVNLITDNQT